MIFKVGHHEGQTLFGCSAQDPFQSSVVFSFPFSIPRFLYVSENGLNLKKSSFLLIDDVYETKRQFFLSEGEKKESILKSIIYLQLRK